jgi:hypothetical protein
MSNSCIVCFRIPALTTDLNAKSICKGCDERLELLAAEKPECPEAPECWNGECQECCEHDYDPSEGMMCLNCSASYPY